MCNTAMIFVSNRPIHSRRGQLLTLAAVPVQNYITAIIVFLIVEQLMTWGYYR
jgi:hypothetical protein